MGVAVIVPDLNFSGTFYGKVTIAEDVDIESLAISGPDSVTGAEDAMQFTPIYTPANTSQRAVTWSIVSGSNYASIGASTGMLSVKEGAEGAAVTIRVTSSINNTIYAEKSITVTYQGEQVLPDGAIPCDYIYTDGYTDFMESGIAPLDTMSFDVQLQWCIQSGNVAIFAGIGYGGTTFSPIARDGTSGAMKVIYGSEHNGNWPTDLNILQCRHKISITPAGANLETYDMSGTLLDSQTLTYSDTPTLAGTLSLFGKKSGASAITAGTFRGAAGRCKVYSDANFSTLIADFVPCYYQNSFGYWDNVAKVFHTTANTPAETWGIGSQLGTQGFIPNASCDGTKMVVWRRTTTSRMFEIPEGCTQIKFNAGLTTDQGCRIDFWREDGTTHTGHYAYNAADREVAVVANSKFVTMSMRTLTMDTCYIYDMTNQQYIWKGKNVE